MSLFKSAVLGAIVIAAAWSIPSAFAGGVGGGTELPSNAEPNNAKSGGGAADSAMPSRGTTNGPSSRGAGTGENKPTATGGQPGGSADQQ